MTPAEEREFDQLPEALRLALMDRARRQLSAEVGAPLALSMRQIGDAAAIGRGTLHWRFQAALLKLRRRAHHLELEP